MFQPKSRYYMIISPKLSSATLVPLYQPKSRYYMIIFPKLSSATLVPLFQPKSRYYMIISLKFWLYELSSSILTEQHEQHQRSDEL